MPQFSFDAGEADFHDNVLEASFRQPVLVDFWAPWCGPCQALKPLLERLADEYGGRFLLARVNSDENQQLSSQLGVRSIPVVKAFVNGELIDEFAGAQSEATIRAFIDRLLPSPADPLRAEALALYEAGDAKGALQKLAAASKLDPRNESIRLDAAELLMHLGQTAEARALLDMEYEAETTRAQALRAQLQFTGVAGDEDELAGRIAADPADLAARVDLAKLLAARSDYPAALEQLLEVVRRDRNFADGIGRKTMLALFDAMWTDPGLDDVIRDYRRRLSAALN